MPIRLLCPPKTDVDLRRTLLSGLFNLFDCSFSPSVCVRVCVDLFKHVRALCPFLFEWFSLFSIDFWIDKRSLSSHSLPHSLLTSHWFSSSWRRCMQRATTCPIVLVFLLVCSCHYLSIVLVVAPIFSSGAVVESRRVELGRLCSAQWSGQCRVSHAEAARECKWKMCGN